MTPEEMIQLHDPEIVQLGISILKKDLSSVEITNLLNENSKKFTLFNEHLYLRYGERVFEKVINNVFK